MMFQVSTLCVVIQSHRRLTFSRYPVIDLDRTKLRVSYLPFPSTYPTPIHVISPCQHPIRRILAALRLSDLSSIRGYHLKRWMIVDTRITLLIDRACAQNFMNYDCASIGVRLHWLF